MPQCQTSQSGVPKCIKVIKYLTALAVSLAIRAKRNTPFLGHKIKGMQRPLQLAIQSMQMDSQSA
jgi:hypothetical protein